MTVLSSVQMAQGDIRSHYKRSLQHKVEYCELKKKQKLRGQIELQALMKKKVPLELLQKEFQSKNKFTLTHFHTIVDLA